MMQIRFTLLILMSSLGQQLLAAQDYHNALDAQGRGDYTSAATAWKQLANSGDPVAQYNLAMLYQNGQGVKADVATAQHWLTQSARQGFTEAYKQLNRNSVLPSASAGNSTTVPVVTSLIPAKTPTQISNNALTEPMRWVQSLDADNYTIQLVSSTSEDLVAEYYRSGHLQGKAGYFRSKRQEQMWYTLVYGDFNSVAEANVAIQQLPEDLKKWAPWIRNASDIKRMIK
jgi:septal ring-binding cell division protein DamX